MKKLIAIALSAVMCLPLIAGCTATPATDTPPASAAPAEAAPTEAPPADVPDTGLFNPGTYTATTKGFGGDMVISVTFSSDAITEIMPDQHAETTGIGDVAIDTLSSRIIEGQTLALDTVTGATSSSTAFLAAVEDCVMQAEGDVDSLKTSDQTTEKIGVTYETDVLVVGAGVAGLTAALGASNEGGVDVLVIEKTLLIGGTANLAAGGFVMVDSPLNVESGVDDSLERTLDYWKNVMSQGDENPQYPDYDRLEYYLKDTGKTAEYLKSIGVPFADTPFDLGYALGLVQGGGSALTSALEAEAKKNGVEFITECTAEELIVEDGIVVGVKASTPTEDVTITAGSIILATGGFSQNPEMVNEFTPELANVYSQASPAASGDGIRMAEAVGAGRFANYWTATASPMIKTEVAKQVNGLSSLPTGSQLGINAKGERFGSEASPFYSGVAFSMIKDAGYPFYFIYDSSDADQVAILDEAVEAGIIFKGDTIEALAEELNIDSATLTATFDRYNTLAAAGNDEDFGKDANNLIPLTEGSLYAAEFVPSTFGSLGGVLSDYEGHALRQDGSVIDGLYVVGETSNRYYYNQYYIGGASLGLYSTIGLRVGEEAALSIK